MTSLFPTLNSGDVLHRIPEWPAGRSVPRIIHQTCRSKTELPAEIARNVARLAETNPDWVYALYDDDDARRFIVDNYPSDVVSLYDRINPLYGAAKADLFRYLLLYKTGGVYLDLKSSATRPLGEILRPDDAYVLAQWRNRPGDIHATFGTAADVADVPGGEFQQWHIIAAPGHPFLKAVIEAVLTNIERYEPWFHGTGARGVLRLTGPIAYTRAIAAIRHHHPHRLVPNEQQISLIYTITDNRTRLQNSKEHYTHRTDSVVLLHGSRAVSARVYSGVKTLWRGYKKRRRS